MLFSVISQVTFRTFDVVIFFTRLIMYFSLLWRNFRFFRYSFHNDIFWLNNIWAVPKRKLKSQLKRKRNKWEVECAQRLYAVVFWWVYFTSLPLRYLLIDNPFLVNTFLGTIIKKKKGQHECRLFFKQQKLLVKLFDFLFKNCNSLFQTCFTLFSLLGIFFLNTGNLGFVISLHRIVEWNVRQVI